MATVFKAVCKADKHSYKGSQRLSTPSFIKGKTYEFTTKSFSIMYMGLGSMSATNEHGVESIMDEKHFNKYFERV